MNGNESSNTTEKPWGEASPLYDDQYVEISRIVVRRGGYSSRHKHLHKNNAFLVVRGRLSLTCFNENGSTRRILSPRDGICTVDKGVEHRFEALEENTIAYEFYYGEHGRAIDLADIVRCDGGGIAQDLDRERATMDEHEGGFACA